MLDRTTNKPFEAIFIPSGGGYMRLPYAQLDQVKNLLVRHGVLYWVGENISSINGGPEFTNIYFGKASDPKAIQALLDSVE